MKRRRVWILIGLGIAAMLFGNEGFRKWRTYTRRREVLAQEHERLLREQERLNQELRAIRHDPQYLEYRARRDLGYLKSGEVEYWFDVPKSDKP